MRPRLPARVPCSSRCRPSWDGQGLRPNDLVGAPLPARLGRIRLQGCHRRLVPRDRAGRGPARRADRPDTVEDGQPGRAADLRSRNAQRHANLQRANREQGAKDRGRAASVYHPVGRETVGRQIRPYRTDMTPPQWKTFVFCGGEWWTHLGSNQGPAD